jgi:hypothetical protein
VQRGSLDISEFVPRQSVPEAISPHCHRAPLDLLSRLRLEYRALTSCVAAVSALALHVPFIATVLSGGGAIAHSKDRNYQGDPSAFQWITIESSSHSPATDRHPPVPPPTLTEINVTAAAPTLAPLSRETAGSGSAQSDDRAGLGAMYGRYRGQIQARVDRAWLRPRTAIGAPIFQCQVQIDQDTTGRVLATTLRECNGSTRWQLSLVHAIQAASPLPAPPNPAVFVHHVLLTFRAAAYSSGSSVQLYEPPGAVPAIGKPDADNALSPGAFQTLAEAARAHSSKAMQLRIEGSKIEVEPERQ